MLSISISLAASSQEHGLENIAISHYEDNTVSFSGLLGWTHRGQTRLKEGQTLHTKGHQHEPRPCPQCMQDQSPPKTCVQTGLALCRPFEQGQARCGMGETIIAFTGGKTICLVFLVQASHCGRWSVRFLPSARCHVHGGECLWLVGQVERRGRGEK